MYEPFHLVTRVGRPLSFAAAIAGIAAFTACSDATGTRASGSSQLSFTTGSPATTSASAAMVPTTVGGHTLDLTGVTLVIDRAHLKRVNNDVCTGEEDEDRAAGMTGATESCAEVRVGPTLVDLPLTGALVSLPANVLPAGTFSEFEMRVSLVRLLGTFDGQAFDVTLPVNTRNEIQFSPPLVVADTGGTSITVNVPVNTWLVDTDGSLIDPRLLLTNQTLFAKVKAQIASSFNAFEDDDHDGHDDHDRNRGKDH